MMVLVRFGRWDEMPGYPKPAASDKFMVGIWHYGRGLAYLNQNNLKKAGKELGALSKVREPLAGGRRCQIGFSTADS